MGVLLDEVATYLAAQLSLSVGATVFKGVAPETPDGLLVIYETPGSLEEALGSGDLPAIEVPLLQIISRDKKYIDASTRAESAYRAMYKVRAGNLGTLPAEYLRAQPIQRPFLIGRDENQRVLIGFNCKLWRLPV